MKKIFIVSAMLMATTPHVFASAIPLSDPELSTRTGRPVSSLPVIPENEDVRVFETSLGALVMTAQSIRFFLGERRVCRISNLHWTVPGTGKNLSVHSAMTSE